MNECEPVSLSEINERSIPVMLDANETAQFKKDENLFLSKCTVYVNKKSNRKN